MSFDEGKGVDRFSEPVDHMHQAARDPSAWRDTLPAMARWLEAPVALLFIATTAPRNDGPQVSHGLPEAAPDQWHTPSNHTRPWSMPMVQDGGPAQAIAEGTSQAFRPIVQSDWYQESLAQVGTPQVLASTAPAPSPWPGTPLVIAYFRTPGSPGFNDYGRWKSSLPMPHVAHALAESARADAAEQRLADAEAALNELSHGILLLGAQAEVLFCNRAAARIFDLNDGLRLRVPPREAGQAYLSARQAPVQAAIDEAVRIAASSGGPAHSATVAIPRPSGKGAFKLQFSPLPSRHGFAGAARVIASIMDTSIPAGVDARLMKSMYGLTRAEVSVAEQIIKGHSLEETGARCGLSVNTLKTHLNHIYAKTNTTSRAMLVRLLMTLSLNP